MSDNRVYRVFLEFINFDIVNGLVKWTYIDFHYCQVKRDHPPRVYFTSLGSRECISEYCYVPHLLTNRGRNLSKSPIVLFLPIKPIEKKFHLFTTSYGVDLLYRRFKEHKQSVECDSVRSLLRAIYKLPLITTMYLN